MSVLSTHHEVSDSEKDQVVQALLHSKGLHRSEQLRRFLEYICRKENDGQGDQISEYGIGVEALGRPPEFSVESDSIVRTRAHELRRRIDDYYHGPGRDDAVRLELPKGTYRPRFYRASAPIAEIGGAPIVDLPSPSSAEISNRSLPPWLYLVAGIVIGLGIAICVPMVEKYIEAQSPDRKLLERAWGPLLHSDTPVAIAVSSPAQMWVREFGDMPTPIGDPPFSLPAPKDEVFLQWYERMTQRIPRGLYFHPNNHSPLWGDAAAAIVATRFLTENGVATELLPEVNIRPAALKNRNAIVLGRADYSPAAAALQPPRGFRVDYDPNRRRVVIWDVSVPIAERTIFERGSGSAAVNYGLISVSTQTIAPGQKKRTFILSGINSDGSHAAVEFLTIPAKMRVLDQAFRVDGLEDWPESFQVVVKSNSNDTYTLDCEYAAHKVIR